MSYKNILIVFAMVMALGVPISGASTITLTGGCQGNVINSTNHYINFDIGNSGNGTAADLLIFATFPPWLEAQNSTQSVQNVSPDSSYLKRFYLSTLPGQGSYAVSINATYLQGGTNYPTVFPCMINVGVPEGAGRLEESVSMNGKIMAVNITNLAPEDIEADVVALVPALFSVKNATRSITVKADSRIELYFNVTTPTLTHASFPVIGKLSYEYNGTHYADEESALLVFGAGAGATTTAGGGGIGLSSLILAAVVAVILILIVASLLLRRRRGPRVRDEPQPNQAPQEKKPDEPK